MTTIGAKSFETNRVLLLFTVVAAALAVASILTFAPAQQAYANQNGLSAVQLQTQSGVPTGITRVRDINTNEVYFGSIPNLSKSECENYSAIEHIYTFKLKKASKVTFDVSTSAVPEILGDGDWEIYGWFGFKLSGEPFKEDSKAVIANTTKWESGPLYLQPGTYKASIISHWSDPEYAGAMFGEDYTLCVNADPITNVESEPNGSYKTATAVKLNKAIKATAYDLHTPLDVDNYSNDADYYSFTLHKKTKVYFRVLSNEESSFVSDELEDASWVAKVSVQKKNNGEILYESQIYGAKDWWSKGVILQPGTYRVAVSVAESNALWAKPYTFTVVEKKANTLTAKAKAKTLSAKTSKTVKISKKKAFTIKNAKGTVTFAKKSGSKSITVNKKTGAITVKKGLKAKTYTLKVKVKAAGNHFYKPATKTVTFKVKVK